VVETAQAKQGFNLTENSQSATQGAQQRSVSTAYFTKAEAVGLRRGSLYPAAVVAAPAISKVAAKARTAA